MKPIAQPSHFVTALRMEAVRDANGMPLCNRSGRRLYEVLSPLVYWSEKFGRLFVVKSGYITDLGSVPRLPLIYTLLGDIAEEPYPLHDMLYTSAELSREDADAVLLEALEAVDVPAWKRRMIYFGVRVGGSAHFADQSGVDRQ